MLYSHRGHAPRPCPWTPLPSSLSNPFFSFYPSSSRSLPPSSLLFSPVPAFFSIATSPSVAKALCVKTVGAQALKLFQEHPIFSEVISDQEAVAAIEKFVGMCQVLPSPAGSGTNWCPNRSHSRQIFLTVLSPTPC